MRRHVDDFVLPRPLRARRFELEHDPTRSTQGRPHPDGQPSRLRSTRGLVALQTSAGNQAVARLMRQNSALNVQRCGPGGCADGGREQGEDAQAAAQGLAGYEEDEYASPEQGIVQRSASGPGGPPAVQRVAAFSAGPVHQVNNLASCVVNGTDVGVTWLAFNGAIVRSRADFRAALVPPTVTTTAAPAGGFDAVVDTIPTNNGSFDETVLAAPPWRFDTTKAIVRSMFPTLAACAGAGASKFRAYGDPSDAAMFAANRRHEDHHATDHRVAFNATIVPWDQKITAAKAANTKFHGATAAAAVAALWAAMGGTPDQIADAFFNAYQAKIIAYHGTPAGGPVGAGTRPGARAACSISWAYYRNPS